MREVKTIATEMTYHFICPGTGKESDLVLFEELTEQKIKDMESKLGGKVYYSLEKTVKATYKLPLDKFAAVKGVLREEIK